MDAVVMLLRMFIPHYSDFLENIQIKQIKMNINKLAQEALAAPMGQDKNETSASRRARFLLFSANRSLLDHLTRSIVPIRFSRVEFHFNRVAPVGC